jgi:hypothetical protein
MGLSSGSGDKDINGDVTSATGTEPVAADADGVFTGEFRGVFGDILAKGFFGGVLFFFIRHAPTP